MAKKDFGTASRNKAYEGVRAEINKQREGQGKTKIGDFHEDAGGGTPGTGGRGGMHSNKDSSDKTSRNFVLANSPSDPKAIKAKEQGKPVRYKQPRKEDGTFTYNSANEKDVKYPGRGHTLPPFLEGVKLTFIKEGSGFVSDTGKRVNLVRGFTEQEFIDGCKEYLSNENGFKGLARTAAERMKQGRRSETEKSAGGTGYIGEQKTFGQNMTDRTEKQQRMLEAYDKYAGAGKAKLPEPKVPEFDQKVPAGNIPDTKYSDEHFEAMANILKNTGDPGFEGITADEVKDWHNRGYININDFKQDIEKDQVLKDLFGLN